MVWFGLARLRHGPARLGQARHSTANLAWLGLAWRGVARSGLVEFGEARHSPAWHHAPRHPGLRTVSALGRVEIPEPGCLLLAHPPNLGTVSPRLRPCLSCGRLSPESRCPDHTVSHWSGYRRSHPELNVMPPGWKQLRRLILGEEPACRLCGTPATDVDHITPRSMGGTEDRANLRALCHDCHLLKTHADGKAVRAARKLAHA